MSVLLFLCLVVSIWTLRMVVKLERSITSDLERIEQGFLLYRVRGSEIEEQLASGEEEPLEETIEERRNHANKRRERVTRSW